MIVKENTREQVSNSQDVAKVLQTILALDSEIDQEKEHFWAPLTQPFRDYGIQLGLRWGYPKTSDFMMPHGIPSQVNSSTVIFPYCQYQNFSVIAPQK